MIDPITIGFITIFLASTLRIATPIILAALGETYVQSSGTLNLGVEGVMLLAAFTGFTSALLSGSILVGVLVGVVTGIVAGAILAFLMVTLRADQIVTGIAFTIAAIGLTSFYYRVIFGAGMPPRLPTREVLEIPYLSQIPILGPVLFSQHAMVYVALVLIPVFHYVLYKTRLGLKVRSLSENPMAADAAGVNVFLHRYLALIVGGAMAGLGGSYLSLYQISFFRDNMTAGRGWVAIAVVMFARWKPSLVPLGAFLYGGAEALSAGVQALGYLRALPVQFILMFPYIFVIAALVILVRQARFPPAFARPYRREAG